jgi:UDP-N-acetylmuramate--alanine ligase
MKIEEIEQVYFIGIGGIGMSALARYFNSRNIFCCGYDKTETELTQNLQAEFIDIHYEDNLGLIPERIFDPAKTLIIYTPAVPADHSELVYFQTKGYQVIKRAEALGIISRGSFCIAVAGTHGKTTTSSMIAHLCKHAGLPITAFLGGITTNYGTNYIETKNSTITVVEADEYDRSFLQLNPDIAIITSAEADHLDIYDNADSVRESFEQFTEKIKESGKLIMRKGINLTPAIEPIYEYGVDVEGLSARNVFVKNGKFCYDVFNGDVFLGNFLLGVPGRHNIENSLAAIGVGLILNIPLEQIKEALDGFKGVKRRFETIVSTNTTTYVDDYAHHPTEIAACIAAARELFPGKQITGIFQPHLYSRTRDFANEFAQSLEKLDSLILLPIYPARELPIEGVTSTIILDKANINNKVLINKQEVLSYLNDKLSNIGVLITMGAGDIDGLIKSIKNLIQLHNN